MAFLSRIVLRVNATSELYQPQRPQERENKKSSRFKSQNKNSECAAHILCCHGTLTLSDQTGNVIIITSISSEMQIYYIVIVALSTVHACF